MCVGYWPVGYARSSNSRLSSWLVACVPAAGPAERLRQAVRFILLYYILPHIIPGYCRGVLEPVRIRNKPWE
jgi:hypothetical protein